MEYQTSGDLDCEREGGGVVSVSLEGKGIDVKVELTCRDAPAGRVTRIVYRRVTL